MRGTLFGRNRAEWFLVLEAMYDLQITLNPDNLFGDDQYTNAEFIDQAPEEDEETGTLDGLLETLD
ncbi:hypothetical protein [Natrinema soli]|nr:hypothetical protein [Natrinema soli]